MRARQWKQFLITWSAIYPLTVLVPLAFSPVYEALPATRMPVIGNFLVSAVICLLMVYMIMPRYTRWVTNWLYR